MVSSIGQCIKVHVCTAAYTALSSVCDVISRLFEACFPTTSTLPKVIGTIPPSRNEPLLRGKSDTRTFNHTHEYAIERGALWYRLRRDGQNWMPLPFQIGAKPVFIDSDGANLIVVEERGKEKIVHFKKVLEEKREGSNYRWNDIASQDNWRNSWCILPFLHPLINLISDKMLRLSETVKSIAISHRGGFNQYVVDAAGQKHYSKVGVTQLYVLDGTGRKIKEYDPWMPSWSQIEIDLPETATTYFVAEEVKVSASTLMAIGYEVDKRTGKKTVKILTLLDDVDTSGSNPAFRYHYFPDDSGDRTWVLPIDCRWREHRLPEGARLSKAMTIIQIGEGNDARHMNVIGCNAEGVSGYYEKDLADVEWKFYPDSSVKPGHILEDELVENKIAFPRVKNYISVLESKAVIRLNDFGLQKKHSQLEFEFKNQTYTIDLYARNCFRNFLGIKAKKYELVLPDEQNLKTVFGNKRVISVSIKQKNATLKITSGFWAEKSFAFSLKPLSLAEN